MHKTAPYLTIYRASAGSGKTYTLTGEYLRLLFKTPDYHRHILAVTFTNKATEEMKSRIVDDLYKMATRTKSSLISEIARDIKMNEDEVVTVSERVLSHLLHDYSRFSVVTIDSFFQRVIRSFAREMGLYAGYNVELDQAGVLDEAVNLMLDDVDNNKFLKEWLVAWAERKIEDGKSWNFKNDVLKLGSEIFSEELQNIEPQILKETTERENLERFRVQLQKLIDDYTDYLQKAGEKALCIMDTYGLSIDDFSRKSQGVGGFFRKLSERRDIPPNSYVQNALSDISGWCGKTSPRKRDIEEAYHNGLCEILRDAVDYQDSNSRSITSARLILKQINVLGILSDLMRYVNEYARGENLFLLSEASGFLKTIIANSDTPFIYERVGSFYNHYMIDEFQDTSSVQWDNFRPLISDSIASGYANQIVGDVKQSIYRWRNTDWKILSEQVTRDLGSHYVHTETLPFNWRSAPEVVLFNNTFFRKAAEQMKAAFLSEEEDAAGNDYLETLTQSLTDAYKDCIQKIPHKKENDTGYIRFSFIGDDEESGQTWQDKVLEDLPLQLEQLQDMGYRLSDIAILVRENKEAQAVADMLFEYRQSNPGSQYRYDVLSNESLLIGNSSVVKWLVAAMRFIVDPADSINRAYLQHEYLNYLEGSNRDIGLFTETSEMQLHRWRNLPVYELSERLIGQYKLYLNEGQAPFLQAFQDTLLQYTRKESTDIRTFLAWWDSEKGRKYVTMPDNQDAIRLITIHKSKGLEFDIVIIPFCDWPLTRTGKLLWCRPTEPPFNGMKLLPLKFETELRKSYFVKEYLQEKILSYIDNLNLLYVAFTRAAKALYVSLPLREENNFSNIGDLVKNVFDLPDEYFHSEMTINQFTLSGSEEKAVAEETDIFIRFDDYWQSENFVFEFGTLQKNSAPQENALAEIEEAAYFSKTDLYTRKYIPHITRNSDYFLVDNRSNARMDKGKLMHDIFRNIITPDDLERCLNSMIAEGKLSEKERTDTMNTVTQALSNPVVAAWFKKGIQVKTEAEILLPDGSLARPDRVVFDGRELQVIDYKFGETESEKYRKQVLRYMHHLNDMGYSSVKGFIWYVSLNKIENVAYS